jgi:hypothetical protein
MIEMDIDTMFTHLFEATQFLDIEDQAEVMNKFADRLNEWHGVTYDQLRHAMENVDMTLEVKCASCNDHMPGFNAGTPICSECDGDSEMSM